MLLLFASQRPTAASHLANRFEVQSDPGGTARILDLSTACHRNSPSAVPSADEALHPASSKMFRTRSLANATLPGRSGRSGRLRPSLHESPPLPDSPHSVLSAEPGSVTRRPRSHKRLSVSGALKALVKVLRERSQQWHS